MKFTRRKFIEKVSITALAAATVGSVGKALGQTGHPGSMSDGMGVLTSQHFEPFLNGVFDVRASDGSVSRMVLTEVNSFVNKANEMRGYAGESFSLIFNDSIKNRLGQGTYSFRHESLGEYAFLAVPVGQRGVRYEVIVNRIGR